MIRTRAGLAGVLLCGPAVLAFFAGGYFDGPRLWAGISAWLCVAFAALVGARVWPSTWPAWLAYGGLTAFTLWTILAIHWSPLRDQGQAEAERAALYLGVMIASTAVLRRAGIARAAEPVLALGTLVVVGEGLSERVLPGLFTLTHDVAASGRLTQPLTYWNAMGILSAIGFVLLVRLVGDTSRPPALRVAAVLAGPPVGLGLYLTLSRGGLLALAIGVAVLVRLAPNREQVRALGLMVLTALPAIAAAAVMADVRTLAGTLSSREADGGIVLVVLVLTAAAGAAAAFIYLKRTAGSAADTAPGQGIRRLASLACAVVLTATVIVFVVAAASRVRIDEAQATSASSQRLVTTDTVRGNFWSVAMSAFVDHPLGGVGAGGFSAEWDRRRTILYFAANAHSLYLETLCDLGIVGALALLALIVGVAAAARRAYRRNPALSTGWIAVAAMWAIHAGFDWDWEMPAASLGAFVLMGAILALADTKPGSADDPSSVRPAVAPATVSA